MNSDVICADFINEDNQNKVHFSFHYEKIKELLQGASICLNTSGKSDMLDELASIKNLNNYKSNKKYRNSMENRFKKLYAF